MNEQKFTVAITHGIPVSGLEELFNTCKVYYPSEGNAYTERELMRILPECDAVLAGGAFSKMMTECAPHLKIISNYGAGYDRVDVAAADEAGVLVTNIPDSTAYSTAELAFALMLDVRRRVTELDDMVRTKSGADVFGMGKYMGHNLRGTVLGIIGMGRIGGTLADMARAFGMKVIYHNRRRITGLEDDWRTLDNLLNESDVVSVHCPLNEQTRDLIGARELSRMKVGSVFINTARGGVVNTDALINALKSGHLGGAGLDVYPNEPNVPEAFKGMKNVVLTPHIGTNTYEARTEMARAAAERILTVRAGNMPKNIVNRNLNWEKFQQRMTPQTRYR